MRCGKLEYDDATGEFSVPGARPRRIPRIVSNSFLLVFRPWVWWWTNEKKYWMQRRFWKVFLWFIVGFLLLKVYKLGLIFLLWFLGHAYVWMVYVLRFLWAVVVWAWDVICECYRCFGPQIRQGWQWFWSWGDDFLK